MHINTGATFSVGTFPRYVGKRMIGNVDEAWLEVPIASGRWIAAYRLLREEGRGRLVIGELRVFPNRGGSLVARPAGEYFWPPEIRERAREGGDGKWIGDEAGLLARAPKGGLTARLLRNEVKVAADKALVGQYLRDFEAWAQKHALEVPEQAVEAKPGGGRSRGRPGRPPKYFAQLAADYVRCVHSGSRRPLEDLAKRRRKKRDHVRDDVRRSRELGFLSRRSYGVSGGSLTPAARQVLRRQKGARRARAPEPRGE